MKTPKNLKAALPGISVVRDWITMTHPLAKAQAERVEGGGNRDISKHGNVCFKFSLKKIFWKIYRKYFLVIKLTSYWRSPTVHGNTAGNAAKRGSEKKIPEMLSFVGHWSPP